MKPQHILLVLKILSNSASKSKLTQKQLAHELGLSVGEVNSALKRNQKSGFLDKNHLPVRYAIKEFLLHGYKYCFPAELGQPIRGIKTAYAAPFFKISLFLSNYHHQYGYIRKGMTEGLKLSRCIKVYHWLL